MSTIRTHIRGNVVGYIALFFALGLGSAWAATELEKNEVKSKHIKNSGVKTGDLANNAVTSSKVADGTLLGEDFAPGQLPQGEQGPQGERGLPGAPGSPGVSGFEIVTAETTNDSTESKNISAECPVAKQVIGGGASVHFGGNKSVALASSGPQRGDFTRWHGSAYEIAATTQTWALRVVAYCASAG